MMKILLVSAALLTFGCLAAEEQAQPSIFVAPFDGEAAQVDGWQPALGEGLAEMFITELTKLKKFQVLESTALKALKDEIKLGEDGFTSKEERVDKGGFAGADYMFRGKVTRFGSKSQSGSLGGFGRGIGVNLGLKKTASDVRIDWRIVDASNRKVLKAGSATGEEKGTSFNVGGSGHGAGGNIGFENEEFMNSALGKATVKALNVIIAEVTTVELPESGRQKAKKSAAAKETATADAETIALKNTPGKVIAVPAKGAVIISLGTKQGYKNGDVLKLYKTIDTKDDSGAVVFTEEKLVGEVTIDVAQEEKSKAKYDGDAEVKAGWVVKGQ
jgi:curli biogenesis system outer membrane secretion channel CsgG